MQKVNLKYLIDEEENGEKCCNSLDIGESADGLKVCRSCGMTFGKSYLSQERRAYTAEEVKNRRRTEPRWRNYGPRTIISTVKTDAKGRQLGSKNKALFSRLSKIQGSLINSIERNFWEAKPKLNALATKLNIPDYIIETAWKIYSEVAQQKLTMGRSIEAFVCASLYASVKIHHFPRLMEEVTEFSMIPVRSVHKSLGLIVRSVLPVLGLKIRPVNPKTLIYKFGSDLNLSIKIQKKATDILVKASKSGLRKMGKDPKGLAAAALYMAAKESTEKVTQTKIAGIAHVTEVTLRTRAKQIKSHL
ncbi:MAG: hypothetical protein GY870_12370 [archaeon]|nr:hypothetical protein [archaeon]